MELATEEFNGIGNDRHNEKAQRRQFPLEINHGHKGADENHTFLHHQDEIIHDGSLQRRDVVGEITHDFPGAAAVVVGNRKFLQMVIQRISKVRDNSLTDVAHEESVAEGADGADEEGEDDGCDDEIEHLQVSIFQHLINHVADDPRHDEVGHRHQDHHDHGNTEQLLVRQKVFQKPFVAA